MLHILIITYLDTPKLLININEIDSDDQKEAKRVPNLIRKRQRKKNNSTFISPHNPSPNERRKTFNVPKTVKKNLDRNFERNKSKCKSIKSLSEMKYSSKDTIYLCYEIISDSLH